MDLATADAIIAEVKSAGIPVPLPERDDQRIELAQGLIAEAEKAYDLEHVRTDAVLSILRMADKLPGEDSAASPPASQPGGTGEDQPTAAPPTQQRGVGTPGYEAAHAARELVSKEHLPVPDDIEGDPEPLPRDCSTVPDGQLRRLYSMRGAYLSRTTWLVGVEKNDLSAAKVQLMRARDVARLAVVRVDANGKAKLSADIDAEISEDLEVMRWEERVNQHAANLQMLERLREIYQGDVDRLSREWTFRREEFERSGQRG